MEEQPRDNRQDMMRLLQAEKPDLDLTDDNAVFGQIIDDYADYARLLNDERERLDQQVRREEAAQRSLAEAAAGRPAEMAEAARSWLDRMAADVQQGQYTAQAYDMAIKALNYDRDIQQAEIRGRNANIQAQMRNRQPQTDGIPRLGASAPTSPTPPSIFDIARG